jgi:hypothetical protein
MEVDWKVAAAQLLVQLLLVLAREGCHCYAGSILYQLYLLLHPGPRVLLGVEVQHVGCLWAPVFPGVLQH